MTRTYSELRRLQTLEERYHYLSLRGSVGRATFGSDRYLNQRFYKSSEWQQLRNHVILRDEGCDLGVPGFEIPDKKILIIHHMNPMTVDDIYESNPDNLNPDVLVTTTHQTHMAIHYGDASLLPRVWVERRPGDTKLW